MADGGGTRLHLREEASSEQAEILHYWLGGSIDDLQKRLWFPGKREIERVDADISNRFGHLLLSAESGSLAHWETKGLPGTVSLIILLDQLSRHVFRSNFSRIQRCDNLALPIALRLANDPDRIQQLEAPEFVFALMPLRHSRTLSRLQTVLSLTDSLSERVRQHTMLLQRFRRATVRSHLDLQGKVWQEGDEILEFGPVDEDESTVPDEPLTKSVESFLHTHMHPDNHALIVSLSGGVDSMCALTVLEHISSKMNNLTIVACHVDYGNRPESEAEAEFLQRYCKKRGVTLLLKQLREIQRDVTPRDEYEAESRMARFELYKRAFKEYGCSAVVVGHHKNDVQENVIANVMRGNNIFELGGMYPTGEYILRSEIRCNSTSALPHLIEVQERLKGSRYGDHS